MGILTKLFFFNTFLIVNCTFIVGNAYTQWVRQLDVQHFITDIEFIDRYTGWACGNNQIYKTTDGGKIWINQPNPSTHLIMQIHPVNDRVVYAAGWWNFLKTDDGGENWISIFSGGPGQGLPTLDAIFFIDENTGWMGGSITMMKTVDGGKSFIDSGRIEGNIMDIYFKNEMEGVASSIGGRLFKTINGGVNWIQIDVITQGPQYNLNRISFINDNVGYVGGEIVFKTTDFGWTWDSVGAVPYQSEQAYCIEFADENTGFSGGTTGTLFKTIDGGQTWRPEQVSQFGTGFFRDIYAYNDSIVWAGGNGKIIFTETGGQVNVQQISMEVPTKFVLHQNYPNPFNSVTIIEYELRQSANIELSIYDMTGREIKSLVSSNQGYGTYRVSFDASNLAGGVYLYNLKVNGEVIGVRKLVLIK